MPLVTTRGGASALGFGFGAPSASVGGAFESIATVTVGSGGAAFIEFTSIPSTYQHLQIRAVLRDTATSSGLAPLRITINGDATVANYARHTLGGNGSTAYNQADTGLNYFGIGDVGGGSLANAFSPSIFDIYDYASTSKRTVVRKVTGGDLNGSGSITFESMLWNNTAAMNALRLIPWDGNFAQHSRAALYGIRA